MEANKIVLFTTCTNRKRMAAPKTLQASSLKEGRQQSVLERWCARLSEHPPTDKASAIYCGRAFKEAFQANAEVSGALWIISAGLGLISSETMIPSYNLTLASYGSDSIVKKVIGERFMPAKWWRGVNSFYNGMVDPLSHLILHSPAEIFVIAISQTYVTLIQQDLLILPEDHLFRVRLIGLSLKPVLDSKLQEIIMPYDERLDGPDGINIGTRTDFAQRAMRHFVTEILKESRSNDFQDHANLVRQVLDGRRYPETPKRKRLSNEDIVSVIIKLWPYSGGSSSKMLRMIRDSEKISCEQRRFQRLFKLAQEKVSL